MIELTGLGGIPGFGGLDPAVPAGELARMDPAALRLVAGHLSAIGRALAVGSATGRQALGELTAGWSAPQPRIRVGRLLSTAEQTAALLLRHGAAIDDAGAVVERARAEADLDVRSAVAEIQELQEHSWPNLLGALVGAPQLGGGLKLVAISQRLTGDLTDHLSTVDAASTALQTTLVGDPTAGPDNLRAGPDALLPPDPLHNPAQRTDQRNRALLLADLQSGAPARRQFAAAILQSLHKAGQQTTAELVVYDPTAFGGQGRAAISVGDLTSAANVAVMVPGIGNSPAAMSGGIDLATDLRQEAIRQDPTVSTAVIAWYGYDIPLSYPKDPAYPKGPLGNLWTELTDTVSIGSAANAAAGGTVLAADLGLIKSMSQTSTRISVLGFSMGSTTVSEAARYRLPVDAIVLLGSPGAGWDTRTAAGYRNVPASKVYVLSYDQDPVTLPITDRLAAAASGIAEPYGPDPAAAAFGGEHIDAVTNVGLLTGAGLLSTLLRLVGDPRHHNMKNYLEGKALTAEGSIVVGRDDEVPIKPGR